jgi:hypothetical protein
MLNKGETMEEVRIGDEIMVRAVISEIRIDEQGKYYRIKIISTRENNYGFNCADILGRDIVE